jgi:conjugative relaxase-like TrwC/TraI family protein
MIRVNQCKNGKAAKGYYTQGDYYASDRQELPGVWGGKAAGRLGLTGLVEKRAFDRLCDNLDPVTGEKLTARMRADRTPGYDINFHACKSVSLLYGLTGNADILAAFRSAYRETLQTMEAEMKTRVRKGGRYEDRVIGNMAWAEYVHLTARPVKGIIDPHLHAHCFVLNAVYDGEEQRWKAGKFDGIKRDAPRFQAMFQKNFGQRLAKLGFPIAWNRDGWEIAGISRATIDSFSLRTNHINQIADKWGITNPTAKDKLGAVTREHKQRAATLPQLRAEWRERLTDEERTAIAQAALRQRRPVSGHRAAAERQQHGHDQVMQRQRIATYERARASYAAPRPAPAQSSRQSQGYGR